MMIIFWGTRSPKNYVMVDRVKIVMDVTKYFFLLCFLIFAIKFFSVFTVGFFSGAPRSRTGKAFLSIKYFG